jgi:hypothetical protein
MGVCKQHSFEIVREICIFISFIDKKLTAVSNLNRQTAVRAFQNLNNFSRRPALGAHTTEWGGKEDCQKWQHDGEERCCDPEHKHG